MKERCSRGVAEEEEEANEVAQEEQMVRIRYGIGEGVLETDGPW